MGMIFRKRAAEKELIDLGPEHYTREEYKNFLIQLGKIGKFLGGNRASLSALRTIETPISSILDVGCGSGEFTLCLGELYPEARVVGIDIEKQAIEAARQLQKKQQRKNVVLEHRQWGKLREKSKSFDVVIATLFCHHLSDDELVDFLSQAVRVARKSVIINDLHRNVIPWIFFRLFSPVLFKNRLIVQDGALSIRKGFIKKEWKNLISTAGISKNAYSIKWVWPYRWVIQVNTQLENLLHNPI